MQARCQCAQITFTLPTPHPSKIYFCHCTECRHQSASAFGISAVFPTFEFPPTLRPHIECFTRRTLSGVDLDCYFCKRCGSRLLHRMEGSETVIVKGGGLEGLTKEMLKGATHIWVKEAVVDVPAGATCFEEEPEE